MTRGRRLQFDFQRVAFGAQGLNACNVLEASPLGDPCFSLLVLQSVSHTALLGHFQRDCIKRINQTGIGLILPRAQDFDGPVQRLDVLSAVGRKADQCLSGHFPIVLDGGRQGIEMFLGRGLMSVGAYRQCFERLKTLLEKT
ncbi:hypothetical protein ASF31_08415 [Brevundimonas sp. Leaf280]|nr:hypothetical protein ASF31_08415 [Brevundimonas sp. Leaf280]